VGSGSGGATGAAGTVGSTGSGGTTGAAGTGGSTGSGGTTGVGGQVGSGSGGSTGAAGTGGSTGSGGTTGGGGAGSTGGGGAGGTGASGGSGGSTGTGGAVGSICPADECPAEPPYSFPSCPSGRFNPAECTVQTDGTCAWHGPTCIPCPLLVCPELCPVGTQAAMVQSYSTDSCPVCGCQPVTTQ
jgi:hypothetical protein